MKKLILKYWSINFLFSLTLFVIYRLLIAGKDYEDGDWLDFILNMMDILLNLGFSLIFLVVLPICSLTFFLNLIKKVTRHYYLSLLSFVAGAVVVATYVLIAFVDLYASESTIFMTSLILSIVYLIFNYFQFRLFRKKVALMDEVFVGTT